MKPSVSGRRLLLRVIWIWSRSSVPPLYPVQTLSIRDSDFCRKMIDLQLYVSSVILFSSDQPQMSSANSAINPMPEIRWSRQGYRWSREARNLCIMQKKHWPLQKKWGIRSLSRRPLAAAAKACVWLIIRMNWKMLLWQPRRNLWQLLAIILCIWSTLWSIRNISSSRFWRIVMVMWSIWASVTAPSREITRSWLKNRLVPLWVMHCVRKWGRRR